MNIECEVSQLKEQLIKDKEYLWNNPEPRFKRDKNFSIYSR